MTHIEAMIASANSIEMQANVLKAKGMRARAEQLYVQARYLRQKADLLASPAMLLAA